MRKTLTALATCAALSSGAALGATADNQYLVRGVGAQSCATFVTSLKEQDGTANLYVSWLGGYLSATNKNVDGVFDIFPFSNTLVMARFIAQVCETQPEQNVEGVTARLVQTFQSFALTAPSEILQLEHNDQQVRVRRAQLVWLQTQLKEAGLYSSTADGQYGPGTRAAITAYQQSKGLQDTGLPDVPTLFALMQEEITASR